MTNALNPLLNDNYTSSQEPEPVVCPNCHGLYLINQNTGDFIPASCNTYKCPVCGRKKAQKLYSAIKKYLENWETVRMWTFTIKASIFIENTDLENKLISQVWHRFVTYVRREKELPKKMRKFDYIKLLEFHKSGLPHLHVLISCFLPWGIIQGLWEKAIRGFTALHGKVGNAYVSFSTNATGGARYVAKYVTKTALDPNRGTMKLYTKSGRVALFIKYKSGEPWLFVSFRNSQSFSLYLSQLRATAHQKPPDLCQNGEDFLFPESFITKYIAD